MVTIEGSCRRRTLRFKDVRAESVEDMIEQRGSLAVAQFLRVVRRCRKSHLPSYDTRSVVDGSSPAFSSNDAILRSSDGDVTGRWRPWPCSLCAYMFGSCGSTTLTESFNRESKSRLSQPRVVSVNKSQKSTLLVASFLHPPPSHSLWCRPSCRYSIFY